MAEQVDLRILQANERTLLAWVRTGLALMAFGFVIARLALETERKGQGHSQVMGISLIAIGAVCEVLGAIRFGRIRHELLAGRTIVPGAMGPIAIATLIAGLGVALLVYLLAQ